jgi:1-acyl-sn-glycerol-3-phosphate acyltransferase
VTKARQPESEAPPIWRGGALARAIATVVCNAYLVIGTLIFAVLAVLAGLVDRSGDATFAVGRMWSRGILWTAGLRVRRSFEAPLDGSRPVIYMANHQSLFDIPLLFVTLPGQARMLAKHSLFRIPIFGWAIRLGGFISIDRQNRNRAKESFDTAVERLRSGTSALVFPEGTRSLDGRLLPFHRGGLLLALKSGLPIVPVGIEGTLDVQPKKSFAIRPRTVDVRYGTPIDVTEFGIRRRDELAAAVRHAVARLARTELAAPAGGV